MGKRWKQCQTLFGGGSKITADGDCSHEIKRRLLLGRKVMTNLDSILKSRDITLPTKVCLVKAMVFLVVMYGSESWTVKKAEHQKIDLLNCSVGEDSWQSLGLQGDPTSPSCKEIQPVHLLKEIQPVHPNDSWRALGLQGDPTSPSCKEIQPVPPALPMKDWC